MKAITFFFVILLSLFTIIASAETTNVISNRGSCNTIPGECISGGNVDFSCVCKVWCKLGCGGSACNCDIPPKNRDISKAKVEQGSLEACQSKVERIFLEKSEVMKGQAVENARL